MNFFSLQPCTFFCFVFCCSYIQITHDASLLMNAAVKNYAYSRVLHIHTVTYRRLNQPFPYSIHISCKSYPFNTSTYILSYLILACCISLTYFFLFLNTHSPPLTFITFNFQSQHFTLNSS